jgi:transposase-like protein
MAVMALPEKYRRRLRTANMQERLNEEIRRREKVIRIFPNDEAALRLMGSLLAEFNETWAERLYINMDEFKEWLMKRNESDAVSNVVAMAL